ncbi:hypothetical protein GBAR_LOCUS1846 [Geodia barretti]|uniref:PWWP domain-containing protein n=1 Tax=Geodia barretti TaxID=519541 RepID=A0AA35VX19_GEOBA|nr:hypothetical protein GBAR_LOCUS1846 [Geodia barretti]
MALAGENAGDGRVSKNSEVTLTLGREREETPAGETTEEGRKEEPVSRMEFEQNKEGTDEPRQKKARVKEPKSAKVVKKLEKKREKEEKEEKKREKERGEEEESDPSSEDDDLPNYQTTSTTKVTINKLKEGDHIWMKWKTFPHWPALVVKGYPTKTKSKARARIIYFGDKPEHDPVTIKYAQRRKLARYVRGNEEYEKFMRAGRECGENAEYFLQSVQEAEAFITAKWNKELTGSALEMFKQICEKRPASMTPPAAWMEQSLSVRQLEPPTVSAFGFPLDPDLMDREKEEEEEEEEASDSEVSKSDSEEEEEENSVYSLEKVLQHFTKLKPTLIEIMSGATPSEYHTVYISGTAKQKQQLALCSKYGPCNKWTISKKMKLIRHLQKIAEESFNSSLFTYAGDVLLPEAMVRTISHFEGISEEEAQKRL